MSDLDLDAAFFGVTEETRGAPPVLSSPTPAVDFLVLDRDEIRNAILQKYNIKIDADDPALIVIDIAAAAVDCALKKSMAAVENDFSAVVKKAGDGLVSSSRVIAARTEQLEQLSNSVIDTQKTAILKMASEFDAYVKSRQGQATAELDALQLDIKKQLAETAQGIIVDNIAASLNLQRQRINELGLIAQKYSALVNKNYLDVGGFLRKGWVIGVSIICSVVAAAGASVLTVVLMSK